MIGNFLIMRLSAVVPVVVAVCSLFACERRGASEASTCDVNEAGINDSTIGPLYIDEALAALRVRCPAVGDTSVAAYGSSGALPALRLVVLGAPIIIRHNGSKVTALHVESPVFHTNDSLGVGSSVGRFRGVSGIRVAKADTTNGATLLDRRRCGVAYELSAWPQGVPPADTTPLVRGPELASWPDSIVVRGVTVSGCHGMTRDLHVDSLVESTIADSAARFVDSTLAADPLASPATTPGQSTAPPAKTPTVSSAPPTTLPPASSANPATGGTASPSELATLRTNLDVPVQGVARSQLRDTYTESRGAGRLHDAIDILAPRGTPVLAAADGRLLKLFTSKAGGLMIYASDPSERFILLYAHLDRYADGLSEGMPLKRGQVIGYVGTTGNAPPGTPHLHFAVLYGDPRTHWWKGTAVNPYPLLTR